MVHQNFPSLQYFMVPYANLFALDFDRNNNNLEKIMKKKLHTLIVASILLLTSLGSFAAVDVVYVIGYQSYVPNSVWESVRLQIERAAAQAAAQAQRDAEAKAQREAEEQARKAQEKAQKCAAEKGKIDQEYAACNTSVSSDKLRETGRCNVYGSSEVSGNIQISIFGMSGSVQNPTYDKCINMVNALADALKDQCSERKANQESLARTWNNAACSGFYQ